MSIVSSTIREDLPQRDGRRHVREVHRDSEGIDHDFAWMAEPGQDTAAGLAARAEWLAEWLAQKEIESNVEEVENA